MMRLHRQYLSEMLARRETGVALVMDDAEQDGDKWLRFHLQSLGGLMGEW